MDCCVVKSHFGSDIRRFTFPRRGGFDDLCNVFTQLYSFPDTRGFLFHYIDDEGDLLSITSTPELQEAIEFSKDLRILLKIYITRKPVMDETAPLFNSWVILKSLVESKNPAIPQTKCKEVIKQVEKISKRVRTCTELLKTPDHDREMGESIQTIEPTITPTPGNISVTPKGGIKDIVLDLSKELAASLAETSETIAKLINTPVTKLSIDNEINDTAGAILKLLDECSEYSKKASDDVRSSSDLALNLVHSHSNDISKLLASLSRDESISTLREETIAVCNSLSTSTVLQCVADSDIIRDLVMNT